MPENKWLPTQKFGFTFMAAPSETTTTTGYRLSGGNIGFDGPSWVSVNNYYKVKWSDMKVYNPIVCSSLGKSGLFVGRVCIKPWFAGRNGQWSATTNYILPGTNNSHDPSVQELYYYNYNSQKHAGDMMTPMKACVTYDEMFEFLSNSQALYSDYYAYILHNSSSKPSVGSTAVEAAMVGGTQKSGGFESQGNLLYTFDTSQYFYRGADVFLHMIPTFFEPPYPPQSYNVSFFVQSGAELKIVPPLIADNEYSQWYLHGPMNYANRYTNLIGWWVMVDEYKIY